jgi:AP2-like factor (ANT lineage)
MATTVHPHSPSPDPTPTTTTTPPSPSPPPPPPSSAVDVSEIAPPGQHLAVVAEDGKPAPGGGKLVAEAMRKHAAPRSSRFHGVTRWGKERNPSAASVTCSFTVTRLALVSSVLTRLSLFFVAGGQAQVERQVRGAPLGQRQPGPGPQAQGQAWCVLTFAASQSQHLLAQCRGF